MTCPICSRVWLRRGSCNCNSTEAVGQWCQDHLLLLHAAFGRRDFYTPTGSLYRRLLPRLDAQAIEVVLAAWVRSSRPQQDEEAVAFDGKTLRGAGTAEQPAPHWASLLHPSEPGNEARKCAKAEKTNEIPEALAVLPCLPTTPRVYTADALHTHAAFMQVAHDLHGFSLLTVKGNQPILFADLHLAFSDPATSLLPCQPPLIEYRRGRIEERSILVTTDLNDYLRPSWPLVQQVAQLTRTVTVKRTGKRTQEIVYLITDLPPALASPSRLLQLNRGHWGIENRLHYVRDVSKGSDRSRLRTGQAPQVLAALRNLALTLIHRRGSIHIAAKLRHFASHPSEALHLLLPRRSPQQ